jgi:hypothetical protein
VPVSGKIVRGLVVVVLLITGAWEAVCQSAATRVAPSPKLIQALVCEDIKDGIPAFPAVTFPISAGKIYCYTFFDQLSEDTVVYHQWFFRDKPSSRIRLPLKQPRWSTYSSIQMREADKGPWRVEVSDASGRVLKTLRFSVTD